MISDENKAAGQDAWALRHGRSGEFPLRKTTTGIRLFILLLAWSLALTPAALAAEAGGRTAHVTIGTGVKDHPAADIGLRWDDGWFAEDAAVYQQDLALASMALSGAAYVGPDRDGGVRDGLKELGFGSVKTYNYQFSLEKSGGRTAYAFGVKKVKDRAGKSVKLVAVVIRGTGEYTEWSGNLNVGSGSDHEGFAAARDELLDNLGSYLSKAGISGKNEKFLITGHSRGGAAANLTAAYLMDAGLAERENVYCYTFAAPAVSTKAAEEGYENIFNIVNGEDLVTLVPLAQWGYRRYGVDRPLPAAGSDGYDLLFGEMDRQYAAMTGRHYAAYQTEAAAQEMAEAIFRLVPAVDGGNMEMVSALLSGDFDGLSALINQNSRAALLMGRTALELSAELTPLLQLEREALVSAHCMAGYYSWLAAVGKTAAQ